jgi:ABC-2 type transport system permease protein
MSSSLSARFRAGRALFRKELASYFQTPVAYIVGAVFLAVTSSLFFSVFFLFDRVEMRQFFSILPILLALLMPALSMRLIAEEKRRGTWEILTTLPMKNTEILLAKFFSVWVTGLFLLLPTLIFTFTVSTMGELDPGPVAGGYLGAVLLIAAYSAAGVFASSITQNETTALIVGLVITLFLALLNSFIILIPAPLVPLFEFLSISIHFNGFSQGIIDSRSVVYLLSLTAGFLMTALYHLNRGRKGGAQ